MSDHAFLAQHGLFEARAPRYTSYPPAPHFSSEIGAGTMAGWLSAIPSGAGISLYIHIPFCRRLCWFCACRTQGTKTAAPLAPYVDALLVEARTVAARLAPGVTVSHLHLGGGTPTILPAPLMVRLMDGLDALLPRGPGAETSVEVDPTVLDDARLDALAAIGVTRASIGVQDFEPAVQEAIGRPQTPEQTRAAVEGLRARGIAAINLDLLYGLPLQSKATLARTMDLALGLRPDRMALYGYAHVPWASKRQVMIRDGDLPGGRARLDLFDLAAERLAADGMERIGIDHFARPEDSMAVAARAGTLRRSFQGYTTDASPMLVGLGASSISCLPQGYAQNAVRTGDWTERVLRGALPTARGHAFTPSDLLEAGMIERLLCDFAIDPAEFGDAAPHVARVTAQLALAWPRAVERTAAGALTVLEKAWPLARLIAMDLDAYATPEGRHSVAI
jgi:oxygen-independent coproporphyrinogen-3 oxidase